MWYAETRGSLLDGGSPHEVNTFEAWSEQMFLKYYGPHVRWSNHPLRGKDMLFEKYVRPRIKKKDVDLLIKMLGKK